MLKRLICCDEYVSVYESTYGQELYDQSVIFYEESDEFEDTFDESDDEDQILEEIPFVYCPSKDEIGQA